MIRLTGDADLAHGLNMSLVEEVYAAGEGKMAIKWASGRTIILEGREAERVMAWLREQPLPLLRDS